MRSSQKEALKSEEICGIYREKVFLCGMYLQKSMSEAFYVEYDFFFGDFSNVKKYPTIYDSDVYKRIGVLTKEEQNVDWVDRL